MLDVLIKVVLQVSSPLCMRSPHTVAGSMNLLKPAGKESCKALCFRLVDLKPATRISVVHPVVRSLTLLSSTSLHPPCTASQPSRNKRWPPTPCSHPPWAARPVCSTEVVGGPTDPFEGLQGRYNLSVGTFAEVVHVSVSVKKSLTYGHLPVIDHPEELPNILIHQDIHPIIHHNHIKLIDRLFQVYVTAWPCQCCAPRWP